MCSSSVSFGLVRNTCTYFDKSIKQLLQILATFTNILQFSLVWQPLAKLNNIIEWVSDWLTRQNNDQPWVRYKWTIKYYEYQLPIVIIYDCRSRYIYKILLIEQIALLILNIWQLMLRWNIEILKYQNIIIEYCLLNKFSN